MLESFFDRDAMILIKFKHSVDKIFGIIWYVTPLSALHLQPPEIAKQTRTIDLLSNSAKLCHDQAIVSLIFTCALECIQGKERDYQKSSVHLAPNGKY